MMLRTTLIVVALGAVLLAGCGGSSDASSNARQLRELQATVAKLQQQLTTPTAADEATAAATASTPAAVSAVSAPMAAVPGAAAVPAQPTLPATATPDPRGAASCSQADAGTGFATLDPFAAQIENEAQQAAAAAPAALAPLLVQMQGTRRVLAGLDPPICAETAQSRLTAYFDALIDGYASRLNRANAEAVRQKLADAEAKHTAALQELAALQSAQ